MMDNEDWVEIKAVIDGFTKRANDCLEMAEERAVKSDVVRLMAKGGTYRHCAELLTDALKRIQPED